MTEVLPIPIQPDGNYFSSPLRRSSPSQSSFLAGSPASHSPSPSKSSFRHVDYRVPPRLPPSPQPPPHVSDANLGKLPAYSSASSSCESFGAGYEQDEDDQIVFPSYDDVGYYDRPEDPEPPSSPPTETSCGSTSHSSSTTTNASRPDSPDPIIVAEDDTAVRSLPSRHVDYLSHDWREEDIWSSWRHIVSKRKVYGNTSRLENASWRTWAKSKYQLRTISPETLNWLKDCDVTWLYGPLQTGHEGSVLPGSSEPVSHLSKSNSFLNKKPILKKRSMSEVMLQRSISASSLVKQAAAAVQAQQNGDCDQFERPVLSRAASDFGHPSTAGSQSMSRADSSAFRSASSSGVHSPSTGERRRIRFDDKVEQCIAVDVKENDEDDAENFNAVDDGDDDSDDGVVMMKKSFARPPTSSRSSSRNSFSGDGKTIAMLPSTTLKYRGDTPEPPKQPPSGPWGSKSLSPSPSVETLRPSKASANFLLDEDDDLDVSWEPRATGMGSRDSIYGTFDPHQPFDNNVEEVGGLRRTPSGMFMPYEEDEDDVVAAGLFGKVVDTVNTAKDIAHVIWNVGWRR
ncbi:MAG: hypothetical protein M1819_004970 [Sarea resinae]|nr:MAG: hypothetical protein M1819_004970 [Sarea resinae]